MTSAWVVRAGLGGEQEQWNLEHHRATVGWSELGDVSRCGSRDELRALVDMHYPEGSAGTRANAAGQVWAFCTSIREGDLVVMPSKSRPGYLWIGRCTGSFSYVPSEPDGWRRMQLPVRWQPDAIAKSAIKDDLLNSLNAILTVFNPTRNNAASRLEAAARTGRDPGNVAPEGKGKTAQTSQQASGSGDVVDPASAPTLEAIRDRISTHLVENYGKHKLTHLVAAILEAQGFVCDVSPEGADGGCDIFATHGPLGFGSPTIVVEVKSETSQVKSDVLRTLHSAVTRYSADHGLLVAWGGVHRQAQNEFRHLRGLIRTWDSPELLNQLIAVYPRLPDDLRAVLPLKQAWVLDDETGA